MNYLNQNIKYLRKEKQWTQDDLAQQLDVKRAVIGSYEEGRAVPKIPVMQMLSKLFEHSIDALINKDLSVNEATKPETKSQGLRVLSTVVDADNKEMLTVVPVKASAGYLNGYADAEYIEQLPRFNMPLPELNKERTYRVFQISGDSMLPILSGSYIICEYLEEWQFIKDEAPYVVLTADEGIVYKRLYNKIKESQSIFLKSDNPEYETYELSIESVSEVWKALGYLSFDLPDAKSTSLENLGNMMLDMKDEIAQINRKL